MKNKSVDIRDAFFDELYAIARDDANVIFLTADMGAHSLARFKRELPRQYINVGIAEQGMVSIAAGLALGGKKVFIYTIIPFATMRCYEQVKIDICSMNLPVTIVGVGAGLTYGSDGPTHHATGDIAIMRALPEITILNTSDWISAQAFARLAYRNPSPIYIRIDKGILPVIYQERKENFSPGLALLKPGSDLTIIASGIMVYRALEASRILGSRLLSVGVIDLYRIKPLNKKYLLRLIGKNKLIVTLEENMLCGGIGSAVSEAISDSGKSILLKRMALPDEHCFKCGDRECLHALYKLDSASIVNNILSWL